MHVGDVAVIPSWVPHGARPTTRRVTRLMSSTPQDVPLSITHGAKRILDIRTTRRVAPPRLLMRKRAPQEHFWMRGSNAIYAPVPLN
jgi:hypothetical protein